MGEIGLKLDNHESWLETYRYMVLCRRLEELIASLAQRGEIAFYVPCSGHEAVAGLARHLTAADWLHVHYRDRALLLARGLDAEMCLHNMYGNAASQSQGRRMGPFCSSPDLHILDMPTVVGNNAPQAAGVAAAVKDQPNSPVVYCGIGDGGTQQGEFYEGVAEAVRENLPVFFVVHDNRLALSTVTQGRTFYSLPKGDAEEFYGMPICHADGRDAVAVSSAAAELISGMRSDRGPRLLVLHMERLASHSNSDDQTMYRSAEELTRLLADSDPLKIMRQHVLDAGATVDELQALEEGVVEEVRKAHQAARAAPDPDIEPISVQPDLPDDLSEPELEVPEFGANRDLTMLEALRGVLRKQLEMDPRVTLYGQDIADPKGDVFGLTRGLADDFQKQVANAPLAEATIVGKCIGRALAGERPVGMFQFADFLFPGFNQLYTELAMMHWRSAGRWPLPVVLMAISGGYRPGLGPYHAQSPTAFMAHCAGLDVYCPSNAVDAAGLLNAAFASGRPGIMFYPKSLINDRRRMASTEALDYVAAIGCGRRLRAGSDLTLVSWGSTIPLCESAADLFAEQLGVTFEVIDLRTVYPWDRKMVLESCQRTGRLLIVHEDNRTCGVGAEIAATVAEELGSSVEIARNTQDDGFIPFNYRAQLAALPSVDSIVEHAAQLLNVEVTWEDVASSAGGAVIINAIGSSPSDETVHVVELLVQPGATVTAGQLIASVEADKASMEISAPVDGVLEEWLLAEGDRVPVGTPLARLQPTGEANLRSAADREMRRPVLQRRRSVEPERAESTPRSMMVQSNQDGAPEIVLSSVCHALGSRRVANEELLVHWPQWDSEDIVQRTGIRARHWIGPGESALSLAVDACQKLFEQEDLTIRDFDALICSTGTPPSTTPSLACRILKELTPPGEEIMMQAHDINAACSGYLYALQQGHDLLLANPNQRILVVTSETLSPIVKLDDPETAFLFGDAATASLLSCEDREGNINARVHRPVLSALGSEEDVLYVPSLRSQECVRMDGRQVFRIAVRKMIDMLDRVCVQEQISLDELDMIVPHQANERIIEAIRKAIKFPTEKVFYYIRDVGNTSSNTIPLSLEALLQNRRSGDKVGLTAFGGGFTFGAGLLEIR